MKLILSISIALGGALGIILIQANNSNIVHPERINGTSLVNPYTVIDSSDMAKVRRINTNWVAIIPFGFSRQGEPGVYFNHKNQWWGEKLDGCRELVNLAQQNNLKVLMKPHIWMREGWIGDYDLKKPEDWLEWEKQYTDYILAYAQLSEDMGVEMLSIGTELKMTIINRSSYWEAVIPEIRKVYSGKLTYAANWDNYTNVTFWNQLDYVGIDSYFPLTNSDDPDLGELKKACESLKVELEAFSQKNRKPILFTEYGFRSAKGGAGNHWELTRDSSVDLQLQQRCYEAVLSTFWQEQWFAGGFLWKWHFDEEVGGENNNDFTPQKKPVESTIKKWYTNATL